MLMMLKPRTIYWPPINLVDPCSVNLFGNEMKKSGLNKALLVTDKVLNEIDMARAVNGIWMNTGLFTRSVMM